jgi:hypothetical protein
MNPKINKEMLILKANLYWLMKTIIYQPDLEEKYQAERN